MSSEQEEYEKLVTVLNNPDELRAYKEPLDSYTPSFFPRLLGETLIWIGNVIYGKPSYLKFRIFFTLAPPSLTLSSVVLDGLPSIRTLVRIVTDNPSKSKLNSD